MEWLTKLKGLVPTLAAGLDLAFKPPQKFYSGSNVWGEFTKGHYREAGEIMIYKLSGLHLEAKPGGKPEIDIAATLNPLDLDAASTTKIALWTGILMTGISKVSGMVKGFFNELS